MSDTPQPANPSPAVFERVPLEEPIVREGGNVDAVIVRRPVPLALQGISLRDIVDMEAGAMLTLLPRITEPALLATEVATMAPVDFLALSAEASGFFLPKAVRPDSQSQ